MKLAIFGATGRTGKFLVSQALAVGHEVKILVRDPAKVTPQPQLTIVQGDIANQTNVDDVVRNTDVVLSTLSVTRASKSKDVLTVGAHTILQAMKTLHVYRFITLVGAGVADSQDPPSIGKNIMIILLKLMASAVLHDSEQHVKAIKSSDLDWVIVRVPRLLDGPRKGVYRTGVLRLGPGAQISRADVADFMLKQIDDDSNLHSSPMVSY